MHFQQGQCLSYFQASVCEKVHESAHDGPVPSIPSKKILTCTGRSRSCTALCPVFEGAAAKRLDSRIHLPTLAVQRGQGG